MKVVKRPSLYYVSKGTGWVRSEKRQFLLKFSTIYADIGWVGRSEKVQKCADVIQGWSLNSCKQMERMNPRDSFHLTQSRINLADLGFQCPMGNCSSLSTSIICLSLTNRCLILTWCVKMG